MDVPEPLRKALAKVKERSDGQSEAGRLAQSLLPLLEAAVAEITTAGVTRPLQRGVGEMAYVVEKTGQGDVLTERRVGTKSKPFRCPKRVLDALATVLGEANRPLAMDEIMAALEARLGDRPADHQVRVAQRLWLHVQPPLLTRNRARYRAVDPSLIIRQANDLWGRLF